MKKNMMQEEWNSRENRWGVNKWGVDELFKYNWMLNWNKDEEL